IGQPDPTAVAVSIERNQVESDLFWRAWVSRCALEHAHFSVARANACHGLLDFLARAHPGREPYSWARLAGAVEKRGVRCLAWRDFAQGHADALEQIDSLD